MTTVIKKTTKPSRKATAPKKPLRIRPELLPETATYGNFAGRDYVMIPIVDFGEWYEDTVDGAVADYIDSLNEPGIPDEEMRAKIGLKSRQAKK